MVLSSQIQLFCHAVCVPRRDIQTKVPVVNLPMLVITYPRLDMQSALWPVLPQLAIDDELQSERYRRVGHLTNMICSV